jgi:hypothetical protein
MSHVDDGTLHAYLDGELTPVERERTETHFAGCAACRARLEEERALIERAGRLLGLAAPPERAAPPLQALRRPRRGSGLLIPLAWAAVVTLAIGVGWYARGAFVMRSAHESEQARLDTGTPLASSPAARPNEPMQDQLATSPATPAPPTGRAETRRDQPPPPTPAADGAAGMRSSVDREEADERLRTAPAAPAAAKTLQAAGNVVALAVNEAKDDSIRRDAAAWPTIAAKQARDILGEDPGLIPGVAVGTLRRNPADLAQIVVEQQVAGTVVLLFERRTEVAAGGARRLDPVLRGQEDAARQTAGFASNERLARYVRSLRVEIAGALSADSLSVLLGLIK